MTCAFASFAAYAPVPVSILVDAARRWRCARDTGIAVQPALHSHLERHGQGMLAPVFDGLFATMEVGLGRSLDVGWDVWSEKTLKRNMPTQ